MEMSKPAGSAAIRLRFCEDCTLFPAAHIYLLTLTRSSRNWASFAAIRNYVPFAASNQRSTQIYLLQKDLGETRSESGYRLSC